MHLESLETKLISMYIRLKLSSNNNQLHLKFTRPNFSFLKLLNNLKERKSMKSLWDYVKNAEITFNHLLTLNLNYFKLTGKINVTDNPKTY